MPRPHRVTLTESMLESSEQAHAILAEELGFPTWYGANLDALEDCLGDIYAPTRIVLVRDPEDPKPWFDALEDTVCAAAQRSCYLGCTIRDA